jgi:hypothetical protein
MSANYTGDRQSGRRKLGPQPLAAKKRKRRSPEGQINFAPYVPFGGELFPPLGWAAAFSRAARSCRVSVSASSSHASFSRKVVFKPGNRVLNSAPAKVPVTDQGCF